MKKTILFSLAILVLGACTRETGGGPDDGRAVDFTIVPQVAGTVTSGVTRARVNGAFGVDSRIGLSITSTSLSGMHSMYDNFFAMFNGMSWGYYLDNVYNGTLLSGFASWGNISVMGYYPYDPAVTDLSEIPFSIAEVGSTPGTAKTTEDRATVDYMVAGTKTLNMAVGGGPVLLKFDHMMTSISLGIKRGYQGPLIRLSKVTLEIGSGQKFGIAGTYDATEPDMDNPASNLSITDYAQTIEIAYTSPGKDIPYKYDTYQEIPLLILPQLEASALGNVNVTVTFFFDDADGESYTFDNHENPSLSFNLGAVENDAVGKNGLLAGYNYVLHAEIGTYIHFEGAPKVVPKDNEDVEGEHIEI